MEKIRGIAGLKANELPSETRNTLDRQGCGFPLCDHDHSVLCLISVCHMRTALNVEYHKKTGQIVITCPVCGSEVNRIAVAEKLG